MDEKNRNVQIWNYTRNPIYRAFGIKEHPTFQEYEEFLESRCFPRTRDKLKIELEQLNIPFYDPLLIIEKTEGRMAEDDFWLDFSMKTDTRIIWQYCWMNMENIITVRCLTMVGHYFPIQP